MDLSGNDSLWTHIEAAVLLIAAIAFLGIGAWFLASVALNPSQHLVARAGVASLAFVFGLICFTVNPLNQGRTLRVLIGRLQKGEPSVDEIVKLQSSVGGAGFFNRIGLTGIPLAVAMLALVFCGAAFVAQRFEYVDVVKACLDLTKLSVGAFIGSLTKKATVTPGGRSGGH
jgi:hypothetical protein